MEMTVDPIGEGVVRVVLRGRLDTPGVDAIETRLTATVVARGDAAIVDLSGVEFAGSMAIRMFMTIARSLARKGGRIALFAAQPGVAQVFDMVELDKVLPVAADAAGALERIRA